MIKFFRKIRQKLLTENKFSQYLIYAIGEILLVMIGILLALQVNNWNENRKAEAELLDIYKQIVPDLDNDIAELSSALERYENVKPVFDKVLSDSRTIDLLDDGLSRILTSGLPNTNLNNSGINRLKSVTVNDSLSLYCIETYDLLENIILSIEKDINDQGKSYAFHYRDNYDWYPEWISKRITKDNSSEELQDYFVYSREYRHYVISIYQHIYNRYLPTLEVAIPRMKKIRTELQLKIDK